MKRFVRIAVLLSGFLAATTRPALCQNEGGEASLLLVFPPRPRLAQLAFDFARLRSVNLLAYQTDPRTGKVALHAWNGQAWADATPDDYNTGTRGIVAREVVVIGSEQDVPVVVAGQPSWCVAMRRVPTTDLGAIVNVVAETLSLKSGEWKWLARRYDLKLEDLNAERRRHGKYGRPGVAPAEKQTLPPEKVELPPEDLPAPVRVIPPSEPPPRPAPVLLPEDK